MTLQDLVVRYLTAFGPASVRDVQAWCGLTRLREVVDELGARLRRFRTEDGAELLDVPDGSLPDADSPAPARFLAEYDNALLSYADRSRVVAEGDHVLLQGGPEGWTGTVLLDGLMRATWPRAGTGRPRCSTSGPPCTCRPPIAATSSERGDGSWISSPGAAPTTSASSTADRWGPPPR